VRNLVTGGSGFLGSHLVDKLMEKGEKVIILDNFFTGNNLNNIRWSNNKNFKLINHDIIQPITLEVDRIWHLACPASPIFYQKDPIKTAKTSFLGTYNMLGLAKKMNAKFLLASTSEVYGDPEVNPQSEKYRGSVNPIGIRACYDEGKRIAETLTFDYKRMHGVDIRVMRIFNTYGPRMLPNDGRVVSNFIVQALKKQDLTIYGDGMQTRSFCYVDDLIDGMMKLMYSNLSGPINIGNPDEYTIKQLAKIIVNKINPDLNVVHKNLPEDDPMQRKPDIGFALRELGWEPKIKIDEGLNKTITYFKNILKK
tara:strand:- start:674 stop:1603 length:930 start_codon:yes stop_codon:yes gene_type:complete